MTTPKSPSSLASDASSPLGCAFLAVEGKAEVHLAGSGGTACTSPTETSASESTYYSPLVTPSDPEEVDSAALLSPRAFADEVIKRVDERECLLQSEQIAAEQNECLMELLFSNDEIAAEEMEARISELINGSNQNRDVILSNANENRDILYDRMGEVQQDITTLLQDNISSVHDHMTSNHQDMKHLMQTNQDDLKYWMQVLIKPTIAQANKALAEARNETKKWRDDAGKSKAEVVELKAAHRRALCKKDKEIRSLEQQLGEARKDLELARRGTGDSLSGKVTIPRSLASTQESVDKAIGRSTASYKAACETKRRANVQSRGGMNH